MRLLRVRSATRIANNFLTEKADRLVSELDNTNVPRHVAFIMDGNGRWAKKHGLARKEGHKRGMRSIERALKYVFGCGVGVMTVYAFSTENWSRPQDEVDAIIALFDQYLKSSEPTLVENKIRFRVLGDVSVLPEQTQADIDSLTAKTAQYEGRTFNIAFNYSGRAELVRAVNRIIEAGAAKGDTVTETDIESNLYTAGQPDPDLIIRTSGEQRLSNFMLYQAAYSEFYFTRTLWPDISERTLKAALDEYKKRRRRFGGI